MDHSEQKSRNFKQWFYDKMHKIDIYAKPITLKFNKKPGFATVPGGCCTLFTFFFFFLFAFNSMWSQIVAPSMKDTKVEKRIYGKETPIYEISM